MNETLDLLTPKDFSGYSNAELESLSNAARNDLCERMILTQVLGNLFASAIQESTYGSFAETDGNLELFGIQLSQLGEGMQSYFDLKELADFHIKKRAESGGEKE